MLPHDEAGEHNGNAANEQAFEGRVGQGDGLGTVFLTEGAHQDGNKPTDGTNQGQKQ